MKRSIALGMVAVALALAARLTAGTNPNTLTLAIFGDSPYSTLRSTPHPLDEGASKVARRRIQQDAGVHQHDQR
jgi:hypothetical protein